MEKYAFQNALAQIFAVVSRANKYIDENEPWRLAKDETQKLRLARVLYNLLETIRVCAGLLRPFMPATTDEIMKRLGGAPSDWESLGLWGRLPAEVAVEQGPALFPRIDVEQELQVLEQLHSAPPALEEDPLPEPLPEITFDVFEKVEMTVVKVLACEKVKKSEKLLKFQLDDGTGTPRQILSGIAKYYEPEALVGKTLVAVTNLAPRKMMGQLSCGMLLSAERGDKLKLLMLDEPSMGLAPILVEQIFEIILKLNQTGTTILLVEQNAQMALYIANRAYVLETGHIVKEGSADTLMHDDAVRKAYLG